MQRAGGTVFVVEEMRRGRGRVEAVIVSLSVCVDEWTMTSPGVGAPGFFYVQTHTHTESPGTG